MEKNKIKIGLPNGKYLVAEQSNDPVYGKEIYIGIEEADGLYIQVLVCVRADYVYTLDGDPHYIEDQYKVLVWADEYDENYTDSFAIQQYYPEEEEEE